MAFSKKQLPLNDFIDKPDTTTFLRNIGTAFNSAAFVPMYESISGVTRAEGFYQMADGVCFVFYRLEGNPTFVQGSTIRLPVPQYKNGLFACGSFFGQHQSNASNLRQFATIGNNVYCTGAFANTGIYIINGFYLTDN